MSISSEVRRAGPYSGNGSTTAFAFAFKVFTTAQVVVTRTVSSVETTLTLTTDYTVSLNANQNTNPGGTVTMLTAPATGQSLTITSNVANLQPTAIANLGGFYPEVINDSLDRATIQIQQLDERLDRTLVIPVSSSGVSTQLPAPEINKVLGWNGTGTAVINYTTLPPSGEIYPVATYAALTATPVANLQDDMLFYVASRSTNGDGGAGHWRYDAASTATADGGTILARDAGGAGRFVRLYTKGEIWAAWFGITQGSTSGSVPTDNVTAITASMAQCNTDGGGKVFLPPTGTSYIAVNATIDNIYNNVLVSGGTQFSFWSNAGTSPLYGTTILPTAAITVLKRRSPYGASNPRTIGGGFEGIRVLGNNIATRLLDVDSVIGPKLHVHLQDCVGAEAARFICGVAGTDLADECTIQHADIRLIVRQDGQLASGAGITSAQAAHCVRWTGSINANVSMNSNIMMDLLHYNGHGLVGDGDQNMFSLFRAARGGGTGLPIYGDGPTAAITVGFENNNFQHYSCNVAGYLEGTGDAGVTAGSVNSIEYNDVGNASPRPTAGTASRWIIRDTLGRYTKLRAEGLSIGSAASEADSAASAITSSIGSYNYNGSNSHAYFATAASVWRMFVDGSTGDLSFAQVTGSDNLVLGGLVWFSGKQIDQGAADSGGAGYKLLRVPN